MPNRLVLANFQTGYETDRAPFLINNDAFPVLNNMYVWRGRLKKKRGTSLLGRLQRSISVSHALSGGSFTLSAPVVPGTINLVGGTDGTTYTDPLKNGTLTATGGTGTGGTINYATGVITINAGGTETLTGTISYYPSLPVMGLEDFLTNILIAPFLVAFDTRYSYQFNQLTNTFYDVTFYAITHIPFTWTGATFQQFASTNYESSMWVTNGVPGFNFNAIVTFPDISATTTAVITITDATLIVGDRLFFSEVQGAVATGINGITGTVSNIGSAPTYTVTLDSAATVTTFTSGIVQFLTHTLIGAGNGLKFYMGDPIADPTLGWVNFAPPLSNAVVPQYLIGADNLIPFRNRLIFFGVTIATSANPTGIYYPNRIVYSQNGTPYYNSVVPPNQVFDTRAWYQNVAGFGGFLAAPIPQRLVTVTENEDVLLCGFTSKQLKLISTGDDSLPFIFQTINSELGAQCTFSGVSLDIGALTIGQYGIAMTTQVSAQRIDLAIPDQIFDISALNNGIQRVTALRDYRNEFIYFTYCPQNRPVNLFPSKTLLYNYRDNNWALFDENYTHYGTFRRTNNITWATLNQRYRTWSVWNDPWNFGNTAAVYPSIIGGNQQGFILIKDDGTYEDNSQYIVSINTSTFAVNSPNHCLNSGDFIEISGVIGITNINEQIFKIAVIDANNFTLLLDSEQLLTPPAGTYLGGGVYRRMTNIFVQSKMFPIFWEQARKTRIGTQYFLIENAANNSEGEAPSQITFNLYTNQNDDFPNNLPDFDYLPYSNVLLTGPEKPSQSNQNQIWHRSSNSFNGDTVQLGFSLSEDQMRENSINDAEIIIHAIVFDLYPGPILA